MSGSVNKTVLLGHLGKDPVVKTFQSGDKSCSFSVATSESWTDKSSGEKRTKTEWSNVVILNQGLIGVCEKYLKKGSKVYIEGKLETRDYEQDGVKKYVTEVVLRPYRGELVLLDSKESSNSVNNDTQTGYRSNFDAQAPTSESTGIVGWADEGDSIPFVYLQDDQIC